MDILKGLNYFIKYVKLEKEVKPAKPAKNLGNFLKEKMFCFIMVKTNIITHS